MSSFTDRVDKLLAERNISKGQFYRDVNVTSAAYSGWNTGRFAPRANTIRQIARYLGVSVRTLTSDDETPTSDPFLEKFYSLDEHGRSVIEYLLNAEYKRIQDEKAHTSEQSASDKPVTLIRHYLTAPAAGYASPVEGEDYEDIPLPGDAPRNADYCVTVSGDSMEPYISDGTMVYVRRDTPLNPYDVGVFYVDGNMYIKQYLPCPNGDLKLLSANPDREDANMTISADSGQSVVCFGKVVLKKRLPPPTYR